MTPRRRWALISLAAIGTAVAAFVGPADKEGAEIAAPVERAHAAPANPNAARVQPISTQLPTRQPIGRQRGDPFATLTWTPKPAASNQPPPKPQPPANPYKFAGTVHHDGVRRVFLILADGRVVEAKEGEMLEQGFRVKAVTADSVVLIYEQVPDVPVTIATVFSDAAAPAPAADSQSATGASAPR